MSCVICSFSNPAKRAVFLYIILFEWYSIIDLYFWKAKFLSFASRSVLIKSVMAAMPNHVMQGVVLLAHICDKLDKINRDFFMGLH